MRYRSIESAGNKEKKLTDIGFALGFHKIVGNYFIGR